METDSFFSEEAMVTIVTDGSSITATSYSSGNP
jgi:hypothetical protein